MMKKLLSLKSLAYAGLLYLAPTTLNAQWAYLGTAGISTGSSTYQSMVLDSKGTLYVAYNDQGLTPTAKGAVMKYTGGVWSPVGAVGFTANSAEYGSLAIDEQDTLYFAYQDGPSGMAAVMKFDGTNWVQVGPAAISTGTATYTCMEVDNNENPYIAYIDAATNRACVKMYDGVSWVNLGPTAEVSAGSASYLTMDLDAAGNPWIGFTDGSSAPFANNITVMYWNGTAWVTAGTAGFSNSMSGVIFADLTISPNNEAYVAYSNPMAGVTSTVQKFDGTTWNVVGTAGFNASSSIFNTVSIDTDDVPYLAYMDGASPASNGSVMAFDASVPAWSYLGASYFSGPGAGYFTSLIDGNTFMYVAYSDGSESGKTSVMRYQLCTPASYPVIDPVAGICEGDSVTLTLTGTLNDDTNWQWYTGGCQALSAGTGTSIDIIATGTLTFYANGNGGCVYAGDSCASITINPFATPVVNITMTGAVLTSSAATGNQWSTGGADIPGATNQTYNVPNPGWYTLTVTNANGCSASDSVFVPTSTGMGESTSLITSVFPVPFTGTLNIQLSSANNATLTVSDPQGKAVFTAANLQQNTSLDLGHLAKGVYYLTVKQENNTQVYRVVKQ